MIYQTGSSLKEAIASCQSIRHVNPSMNFDSCTSIFTAIRAAEIQGQATINAGHSTFYAGAFALAAGVISFLAVIYDHRYEKKKNNRKIISQVSSIKEFLRKIEKELDLVGRFIKNVEAVVCNYASYEFGSPHDNLPIVYMNNYGNVLNFDTVSSMSGLPVSFSANLTSFIIEIPSLFQEINVCRSLVTRAREYLNVDSDECGSTQEDIPQTLMRECETVCEGASKKIRELKKYIHEIYNIDINIYS